VVNVRPGGPAANAGLCPGDVITTIAGQPVTDVVTLREVLARHDTSEPIDVTVRRASETQTAQVELEELAGA
jgi:S1-C subfamily serine protease